MTSPSGTTVPPAASLTDTGGRLWTISGGVVLVSGIRQTATHNVTLLLLLGTTVYQQNSAGNWWPAVSVSAFNIVTWGAQTTDPRGSGTIGATGATGPSGPPGVTGATGPSGSVGATGPSGIPGGGGVGPTGAVGPSGAMGAVGPTGASGAIGASGPTGSAASIAAWLGGLGTTDPGSGGYFWNNGLLTQGGKPS